MALLFTESFDRIGDLTKKWDFVGGVTAPGGSWGRNGTAGVWCWDGPRRMYRDLGFTRQTLIAGVAGIIRAPSNGDDHPILSFHDGATMQIDVRYHSSGLLKVVRGGATTLEQVSIGASNDWRYVELKATIGNSGSYEVRLNEDVVMSASGVDTQESANAYADRFWLGPTNTDYTDRYFDDVYLCDNLGDRNNDFLGDVFIEAVPVNGNGTTSQLDGSDGNQTDNYLLIDDATPNDDTDYVGSSDLGDKDTYALASLAASSGTILGVVVQPYAKKTIGGDRTVIPVLRHGGSDTDYSALGLTTGYRHYQRVVEEKPGGGQWTISDIAALEAGVKIGGS